MSIAAFCLPRPGHGLQAMMLHWERMHPVNAVQFARLDRVFAAEAIVSAAGHVFRRLANRGRQASAGRPPDIAPHDDAEPAFEFQHRRFSGDWRACAEHVVTAELNRGYGDTDPPWRILLLESPHDGQLVGMAYRHVVADARSIALLLHEIIRRAAAPSAAPSGHEVEVGEESLRNLYPEEFRWRRLPGMARTHARELWASRRAFRPPCADPRDLRMEFRMHGNVPLQSLKDAARRHGATINDLVFAAILEWMACRFPPDRRGRRRDLAVAALADMACRAARPLPRAFGQYLSQYAVRLPAAPCTSFGHLVRQAAAASREAKRIGPLIHAARGFEIIAKSWDWIPILRRPELLPALIPVLAGVSNVHLAPVTRDSLAASVIRSYFRGTCVTHMLPMMLTLTTAGDVCTLTTSHRSAIFSSADMTSLARHLQDRLGAAGAAAP